MRRARCVKGTMGVVALWDELLCVGPVFLRSEVHEFACKAGSGFRVRPFGGDRNGPPCFARGVGGGGARLVSLPGGLGLTLLELEAVQEVVDAPRFEQAKSD